MLKKILAGAVLAAAATGAFAQAAYPAKPIQMIVPFAAGGPTDVVARALAQSMSKALGGNVVVENKPGAGGTLASELVKNAPADGYTVLIHHIGMSTAPALYRALKFNPLTDYEYIGQVADVPMTLVGKKELPPNTFRELLPFVKANADKLNLANAGLGAASHLCGLLLMQAIQTDLTTVPYKGTAPAMTDLQGGQVDLLCDQTTQTTQLIQSGRIKAYGATTKERVAVLPNVPTLGEQGLPGFEMVVWHGIYAPKGTPKPAVDRLVGALQASLADPQFRDAMAKLGTNVVSKERATPEGLRTHLASEIAKWGPIIKKAGQYAD